MLHLKPLGRRVERLGHPDELEKARAHEHAPYQLVEAPVRQIVGALELAKRGRVTSVVSR